MHATMKRMNNDMAVSPIVATLVLIVVAVIGAVAVGTIMGTFSSDVSKSANAEGAASASSNEIIIAGSTTVQPASEAIAKLYMADHPGVKITVQGGGSDAGIASALMDIVDIGSASKAVPSDSKYADLKTYQIGGSAVVVIANQGNSVHNITAGALNRSYALADSNGKVHFTVSNGNVTAAEASTGTDDTVLYQRAEGSGTEETFAEFIGNYDSTTYNFGTVKNVDNSKAVGETGNAGVLAAVAASSNGLGFVDYGYATSSDKALSTVQIVGISASKYVSPSETTTYVGYTAPSASATTLKSEILASLKGTATFPTDVATGGKQLSRPLNYITNGEPNSIVKNYIQYAQSPASKATINDVGMFSIVEFS